jgi:hypothetical protein
MALPGQIEMRLPALQWAMGRRGYLSTELKAHLAELFKLTPEELALTSSEGLPVFGNNVDWVTAHFTETGIHTSIDGRPHRSPDDRYYLTRYGYAVGEGKAQWPRKRGNQLSHGPRRAPPDPRQLQSAEVTAE